MKRTRRHSTCLALMICFGLWPIAVLLSTPSAEAQATAYDACQDASGNALLRYGRLGSTDRAPDGRRGIVTYRMKCHRDPWRESGTPATVLLDRNNPVVADAYRQRYGRPAANTGWRFRCGDERSQLIRAAFAELHGRQPDSRETEDLLATCGSGLDWQPPRTVGCPSGWECDPNVRPCDGEPGCLEVDEILDRCRESNRTINDPGFAGCRRDFIRWRCNVAEHCLPTVTPEPDPPEPEEPEEPETPSEPETPEEPQGPVDPQPGELDEIRGRLDLLERRVDELEATPPAPVDELEAPGPVSMSLIPGSWVAREGDSERIFPLSGDAQVVTLQATLTAPRTPAGIFPGLMTLRSAAGVVLELKANTRYRRTDRILLDPHDGSHDLWAGGPRRWRPGSSHSIKIRIDLAAGTVRYAGAGEVSPPLRLGVRSFEGLELVLGQQRDVVNAYVRPLGWVFEQVAAEVEP